MSDPKKEKLRIIDLEVTTTDGHWAEAFIEIFKEHQKPGGIYRGVIIDVKEWPELNQFQVTYALTTGMGEFGHTKPPFPCFQINRDHSAKHLRHLQLEVGDVIEVENEQDINPKIKRITKLGKVSPR